MSGNGSPNPQFLAPPAVTALRQEARAVDPKFPPSTRSPGDHMVQERQDLKEAAEQTLNVIVDLDLDGRVKWVSPSWRQVVGTPPQSIEGHMISDILVGNQNVFQDAIESMKVDDSRSRFIRFALQMGPDSLLRESSPESQPENAEEGQADTDVGENTDEQESQEKGTQETAEGQEKEHPYGFLHMEAQGIMVFDRATDGAGHIGHVMWMLRPFSQPREVTIDLPPLLVESLGVGAEVLANYLTTLAEAAANEPDPAKHPAPDPILCRICERQITPWWFEKHSDLCLQEHRSEMDVQIAQENLNEHRHAIVKVLDALEARQSRPMTGDGDPATATAAAAAAALTPQPEYKGLPIGPTSPASSSAPSSGVVSSASSAPTTPPRSREHSTSSTAGHARGRSFAVRRPLARIVELVLDLCDTALEVNIPVIKEVRPSTPDDFRTLSPQSESRIMQVIQWQSPSSNTLEQEQGLAALSMDTEQVCRTKVDAVMRHRKIVEYSERIRIEYTVLVEECIAAALSKAERIAAGHLSDSSSYSEDEDEETPAEDSASATEMPPPSNLATQLASPTPLRQIHDQDSIQPESEPEPETETETETGTGTEPVSVPVPVPETESKRQPEPESDPEPQSQPLPSPLPPSASPVQTSVEAPVQSTAQPQPPQAQELEIKSAPLHQQPMSPPRPSTTSALTMSIRNSQPDSKVSSAAVSTGPSSPMECPTPRSHKSTTALSASQTSRRGISSTADTDIGDNNSDSSIFSSAQPGPTRTDSPCSDRSADRKRRSLVLPGLANSPKRQPSPARAGGGSGPRSPLRMPKPRLSSGAESLPSPMASPLTNASELALHHAHHLHFNHNHHHRRQSSATSSEAAKPPVSPRMTQQQPRPAPPSIKDFEIIKPISKGAFGSVYLSKKKTTGEYFAIKVLKKADMISKNQTTNVKAERAIMMWQGESDFVAKLYWTFSSKDYLYLVMEYLNGGDCASLVKVLGGLPEDWAKKYIAEVVLGVEHLHGRGIVHRDLKPDNLLIDQTGHLKLTDFGLSRMGLVGRQKRLLKSLHDNEPAPDPLKQEESSFPRGTSIASSRSASFDFQGVVGHSPGSTPLITPEVSSSLNQPSYFNLSQSGLSRQSSRRESGYRSDSVGSDHLNSMFRTFSLNDSVDVVSPGPIQAQSSSALADEQQSEISESPSLHPLQPTASNQASYGTPPQQTMLPPLMALFDPEDHNRRFVGTPDYLAPETINGLGQDEMSDWWSLGCIMFEFLFGYPPFNASTPDEVFDNILHRRINWPDEIEELATPESIDLVNKLITVNPRERLGANVDEKFANGGSEIRSHPWFSDVNWDTLLEDKAEFVPNLENPEDTEYFDARGATFHPFSEDQEGTTSPQPAAAGPANRPHDALFKVHSQSSSSSKRSLVPLSIPPHVRRDEPRSRRLSETDAGDDFGSFSYKNLPMLEKANKDQIQKLREGTSQAQQRPLTQSQSQSQPQSALPQSAQPQAQGGSPPTPTGTSLQQAQAQGPPPIPPTQQQQQQQQQQAMPPLPPLATPQSPSAPSLESSPLPMSLQRAMSQGKAHRPSSPSGMSQAASSPGRPSQPSSPLLVQFSTGQNHHERRKTSGSSSTNSQQSNGSFPSGSFEQNRMPSTRIQSTASSPIKTSRVAAHSPDKMLSGQQRTDSKVPARARSQTVGSQDGGELSASLAKESYAPGGHSKRMSQLVDASPSSSDNEDPRTKKALLKVQRRRQSSRRLSQIHLPDGPFFRPLDVLICEDHPVSRIVMERLFEKLHCRTISAVNGGEATSYALSEVQFDIIMTEFKLPQLNGADFARMVRETRGANRHTPIIAVTGYLKDLPEVHHFDTLIEKPPTLNKLKEALCQFCQWKPPPKDYNPSQPLPVSGQVPPVPPLPAEGSPSSTASSGFVQVPGSYRGSSREDSISSSCFGDMESIRAEDVPVVISRHGDEWVQSPGGLGTGAIGSGGLGISDEAGSPDTKPAAPAPQLLHAASTPVMKAPGALTPRKQRSTESIQAKRESMENQQHECAESGDDEDEELGSKDQARAGSPQSRGNRTGSKLGIEMMRTNSRGSVVSGSEEILKKEREALRRTQSRGSDEVCCEVDEESDQGESNVPGGDDDTADDVPGRNRSGTLIRGGITPPIVFPQSGEGELRTSTGTSPETPTIKTSEYFSDSEVAGALELSQGAESEMTPRPLHTPMNPDPDPTPRK